MSKPKKTAADFIPRDWVALKAALRQLISITGSRDRGLSSLNRGLRSGRLRSVNVQSSPDGSELMTRHDPSYWEQRAVGAPQNPEEGVWVEPYEAGGFYVRAVDLAKFAGTPKMAADPQSDDTESSQQTTPASEKQAPGVKPFKDWPNRFLAPEIVRVAYEAPDLLLDRPELVKHVRNFLAAEIRWEPHDNKPIHRELDRLLSRIIK